MKILIFSWRGPSHPHAGGAEYASHEHAKGWVKSGHQVTLFTSSFARAKHQEEVNGVHIIRGGNQIFGVHLRAIVWYLFGKHPDFDIVIDEVHGIPFFTPLFIKKPKLVFIHEVAKEVWTLNPWPRPFNLLPAFLGTLFEPLIFKLMYKNIPFMTVSNSTKNDLLEWDIPEKNITIVHNGFKKPTFLKQKKETKKTIIYLGALSKDKGIEDALEAFGYLFKMRQDMQFWVVGKGERHYLEYLTRKVSLGGIDKVTRFFGFVSEREKYQLLSKAHILINPSIREGWGFVVIEAASCGIPTVAYNVAGLKDSVIEGKTGLLCDPSPRSLANKVLNLVENKKLYDFLCKNAFVWSKKFSWSKSIGESLKLLQRLSRKHP